MNTMTMNFKFFRNIEYKVYHKFIKVGDLEIFLKITTDNLNVMNTVLRDMEIYYFIENITPDIKQSILNRLNMLFHHAEEVIYPETIIPL